jgi:2-keto-3-deoxy-6-phosphogluconate aldolase
MIGAKVTEAIVAESFSNTAACPTRHVTVLEIVHFNRIGNVCDGYGAELIHRSALPTQTAISVGKPWE